MFTTKEQLATVKIKPSVLLWQVNNGEYQPLLQEENATAVEGSQGFDEEYFWDEIRAELKAATGALDLINGFVFCNFAKDEYVYVTGNEWSDLVREKLAEHGAVTLFKQKVKAVDLTDKSKRKTIDLTALKPKTPPKDAGKTKVAAKSGKPNRPGVRKKSKRR